MFVSSESIAFIWQDAAMATYAWPKVEGVLVYESWVANIAHHQIGDSWLIILYPSDFSQRVRRRGDVLPDKRDRFTWNKHFYVDLCAVLTFLIPHRRPEALVSILTLFYNLGDIGSVATFFSTNLADNVLTYVLCDYANFHAQMPACRATVAQTVSPQKHCTLGAT